MTKILCVPLLFSLCSGVPQQDGQMGVEFVKSSVDGDVVDGVKLDRGSSVLEMDDIHQQIKEEVQKKFDAEMKALPEELQTKIETEVGAAKNKIQDGNMPSETELMKIKTRVAEKLKAEKNPNLLPPVQDRFYFVFLELCKRY